MAPAGKASSARPAGPLCWRACPLPPQGRLILALPALIPDATPALRRCECGCMLALSEFGSSAPEPLQAGWPIRYWLPASLRVRGAAQPLATALGLLRLASGEAQQEDDLAELSGGFACSLGADAKETIQKGGSLRSPFCCLVGT